MGLQKPQNAPSKGRRLIALLDACRAEANIRDIYWDLVEQAERGDIEMHGRRRLHDGVIDSIFQRIDPTTLRYYDPSYSIEGLCSAADTKGTRSHAWWDVRVVSADALCAADDARADRAEPSDDEGAEPSEDDGAEPDADSAAAERGYLDNTLLPVLKGVGLDEGTPPETAIAVFSILLGASDPCSALWLRMFPAHDTVGRIGYSLGKIGEIKGRNGKGLSVKELKLVAAFCRARAAGRHRESNLRVDEVKHYTRIETEIRAVFGEEACAFLKANLPPHMGAAVWRRSVGKTNP